ncbi:MAG TPA: protein phosphatase CheZ [Xanthobacteraceae bacterium]|nr:protein phosphatase CheZ [Xanthobacteraceae bacterium]
MQARRKPFRVETMDRTPGNANWRVGGHKHISHANGHDHARHDEIMSELRALRSLVKPQEQVTQQMIDAYKAQIAEAAKLKSELDLIHEAINETKQEIATLHVTGFEGPEMARVTNELDAIVGGTERATETILASAEDIDQMATTLTARLKDEQNQALAADIQDRVIKIFEACNFQDLTGQRITKVVATLKFIETHIMRMMEIWGGMEAFKDIEAEAMTEREGDAKLLNGPKIEGEAGHASQDDIDSLFA